MTCAREPLSIDQIVLKALEVLSPAEIKEATGKAPDWFYKVSNPNSNAQLSMPDAEALDNALSAAGFPRWFTDHWSRNTMTDDEYQVECLFRQATKVGTAYGDLCAVIERVMADGELEEHEKPEVHEAALRCEHSVQPLKVKGLTGLDRRNGAAPARRIRETAAKLRAAE